MYNASYLPQRGWGNFTTIVYFGNKNWEIGNGECIRIPASVDPSLPSDGHYLGRGDGARVLPDDGPLGLERLGDCRRVVCRATDVAAPAVVRVKPRNGDGQSARSTADFDAVGEDAAQWPFGRVDFDRSTGPTGGTPAGGVGTATPEDVRRPPLPDQGGAPVFFSVPVE